jgi:hypothetical protein
VTLAHDRDAAAAVASAQPGFAMGSDETRREIDRFNQPELASALDSLPKQCRADFEKFLTSGEAKSKANASQAATSDAKLDKDPQCRDAMKRIASVLGALRSPIAHPRRPIRVRWVATSMAAPRRMAAAVPAAATARSPAATDTQPAPRATLAFVRMIAIPPAARVMARVNHR